jgi:hypothetical protein
MNKISIVKITFVGLFAFCLFGSTVRIAHAAADPYGTDNLIKSVNSDKDKGKVLPTTIQGAKTVPELIGVVVRSLLAFIGIIFFILIFYSGINWMIARGNSEKIDASKDTIVNASIGLVIVLAAYAITNFVFSSLSKNVATDLGTNPDDSKCTAVQGTCGIPSACVLPSTVVAGLCSGGADHVCCVSSP